MAISGTVTRSLSRGGRHVVKPFSAPELMARVRRLLERSRPERFAERLHTGGLDLDRQTRRVQRGSRVVQLGPTEFRLLEYVMGQPGRIFSRAQLLDAVWGRTARIDERSVDVRVGRLRRTLSKGRNTTRSAPCEGWGLCPRRKLRQQPTSLSALAPGGFRICPGCEPNVRQAAS
jgi:two-component system phosphate regulon response regulator PhoB